MPATQPETLPEAYAVHRIRTIFLQPEARVSIDEAAGLLGWTAREMETAILRGEVEVERTCREVWIEPAELQAKALELWPLETIEAALGDDRGQALPGSLRLTGLHVRLPRGHVELLEHLAARRRTTVSDVLTRELDAIASGYAEVVSGELGGCDTAMHWPEGAGTEGAH